LPSSHYLCVLSVMVGQKRNRVGEGQTATAAR
jgi:hypothetical protein